MKIRIDLDSYAVGNDAMAHMSATEVATWALAEAARVINHRGLDSEPAPLRDFNGNTVGTVSTAREGGQL